MSAGKILSIILCQMEAIVYLTHFNQAVLLQSQMLFSFDQLNKEKHSHESTKKRLFANEKQLKQLNRGNYLIQIRVQWFSWYHFFT